MPNFWTKVTQKISESFSGPRTKDTEFETAVKDLWMTEKGLNSIRGVFQNISNFTANFKNSCIELSNSTKVIYEKDSPYASVANSILTINEEMVKYADEFNARLVKLYSETNRWNNVFNELKSRMCKREEARKIYDHYEEKMDKISKQRSEKLRKGAQETPKELDFYKRVFFIYKNRMMKSFKKQPRSMCLSPPKPTKIYQWYWINDVIWLILL
jgi:hypothetical protein